LAKFITFHKGFVNDARPNIEERNTDAKRVHRQIFGTRDRTTRYPIMSAKIMHCHIRPIATITITAPSVIIVMDIAVAIVIVAVSIAALIGGLNTLTRGYGENG
jgi:hypothetical protein